MLFPRPYTYYTVSSQHSRTIGLLQQTTCSKATLDCMGCFAVPSMYLEVPQLKGLGFLNCKVSVFNTNTETCNVRYLEWVWGIPSLQTGCGPLHPHRAICLLHHGHSMHEMTNNRFKVLRRESNLHFDSRVRTKDYGMGLKHLHIDLDILMWVDGNLIESSFMDIKHTRAGIEGACG